MPQGMNQRFGRSMLQKRLLERKHRPAAQPPDSSSSKQDSSMSIPHEGHHQHKVPRFSPRTVNPDRIMPLNQHFSKTPKP